VEEDNKFDMKDLDDLHYFFGIEASGSSTAHLVKICSRAFVAPN
jgi:hypothetical protein